MPKSGFIAHRRVTAFFGMTFAISWTIWSVSSVVSAGDRNAKLIIDLVGAYGPALAAIFVSGLVGFGRSWTVGRSFRQEIGALHIGVLVC